MAIDLDKFLFDDEPKRGKRGLSIVGVQLVNGDLIVTLSNGMKMNAGPIPTAVNGEDGTDGKDGQDGSDGGDGQDGSDGSDGKDGGDGSDGKDGEDGSDGGDGTDGTDGSDGKDGDDGVGVSRLRIKEGELIATLSDGTELSAGRLPKSRVTTIKGQDTFYDILPWGQNKGDITVYTGSKWEILPVGTTGQSLTVDPTTDTGLAWATVGVITDKLLLENGDGILLENGDNILLG